MKTNDIFIGIYKKYTSACNRTAQFFEEDAITPSELCLAVNPRRWEATPSDVQL